MPLVALGSFGYGSFEPFLFDIIEDFRKSNVSESKRLFTLKRHDFKMLVVNSSLAVPSPKLELAIKNQLQINWSGIHGVSHLARVYENGLHLAESTGANKKVIQLFAVFHDSRRYNESWDPEHGPRGTHLAESWRGKYFELSDDEFDLLFTSCSLHTKAKTHVDETIQTCFDADRLDLGRE